MNNRIDTTTELAILMRLILNEEQILEFIPTKVMEGTYVYDAGVFIGKNGITYMHISDIIIFEEMKNYKNTQFYCSKQKVSDLKTQFPNLTLKQIKETLLEDALKSRYYLSYVIDNESQTQYYDILKMNNETKKLDKFIDEEATCANYINQEVQKLKQELDDSIENIIEKERININYSFQPKELSKYIKSNVFGQDKAIDKIVQSIWSNYYFIDEDSVNYNKENILVVGPSGVGKTEIFRRIQEFNKNIIVHITDLSSVTETGYVGESLSDIIHSLLLKCIEIENGMQFVNIDKAEHSIIVLDEFDKIAMIDRNIDVGNRPIQEELLKMMEGKEYTIPMKLNGVQQNVMINTKNITFACCGVFDGITKNYEKQMGFGQDISKNNISKSYIELSKEDFIKYGFLRELIGRLPAIVQLNNLDLELFIKIMKDSKKSLFIKKVKILKSLVENVDINDDLYEEIAKIAMEKKVGARGIDEVSVDLFFPILNDINNSDEVCRYAKMDKDTVKNPENYVLKKVKAGN